MSLDIRATEDPERFRIYAEDEWVGEIRQGFHTEEDIAEGDLPDWDVEIWSVMGTSKKWKDFGQSFEEAKEAAEELYAECVAERRELSKGANRRTTSIPMGGQRGWRRR